MCEACERGSSAPQGARSRRPTSGFSSRQISLLPARHKRPRAVRVTLTAGVVTP